MTLKLITTSQIAIKLKELILDYDQFYWAVAWGSDGPLADELISHKKKIKQIVIGTHFYQTEPKLLEKLLPVEDCKIAGKYDGTFHPKIYLFEKDNKAAAIVGSANFTRGGTVRNIEAALLIEGNVTDDAFISIRKMVDEIWKHGEAIKPEFLKQYTLQYYANKRHRDALNKPVKIRVPKAGAKYPNLLSLSWDEYVDAIKNSVNHNLDNRLNMLRMANQYITSVNNFSELEISQRKAIAGIIGPKEKYSPQIDQFDWGWFGSMIGAGTFKNRIINNDPHLSEGLEYIPSLGEVNQQDYINYITEFRLAFRNTDKKGTIITASRLLAMKRPDYFVCVDSKNISSLSKDLGFTKSGLNFETYWDEIVDPITQAKWWQASRPKKQEGQIWDARAAMIDTIYYDPT